jgi:hypothetical protein
MLLKALTRLFKLLATAAKTQALPRGAGGHMPAELCLLVCPGCCGSPRHPPYSPVT